MNEKERQALAEHLASLKYKRARAEIRKLDTDARLKYWRNAIHNEWHTTYELPNVGLRVTLVEVPRREPVKHTDRHIAHLERVTPEYVEARVENLADL
ncbi:MAG: hypothetical protein ACLFTK_09270 [Anaerolineales bacterium]